LRKKGWGQIWKKAKQKGAMCKFKIWDYINAHLFFFLLMARSHKRGRGFMRFSSCFLAKYIKTKRREVSLE
jgi:hypothetical protein